jgi:hypothetical protein
MEVNSADMALLIKKITKIVINNYITELMDCDINNSYEVPLNKQILVLVPEFVANSHEFLKYLVDKHPGYEIILIADASVKNTKSELKEIKEILNINEEQSRLRILKNANEFYKTYCVMPGINQLEALVNGDDSNFIVKLMLYLVLHDKAIGIIIDYDIQKLPNSNLIKKLSGILREIKTMKISIEVLCSKSAKEKISCSKTEKILLTEKYINELNASGTKVITNEQEYIITPLARDRMRELGIKIANG